MCGIMGYTGNQNAVKKVLEGLTTLEYRGYDSAGIGYFCGDNLCAVKEQGKLYCLKNKISSMGDLESSCAIGHTRWATHGQPSDANAHPHGTENVLVVHNGIIENSDQIKKLLADNGYTFSSSTDTEAAAKLIDFCYASSKDPIRAIRQSLDLIEGAYAIAAIFKGFEGKIYTFRKENSLVVATCGEGSFVTSDVSAFSECVDEYYELNQGEIAMLYDKGITFLSPSDKEVKKEAKKLSSGKEKIHKENFEHFMLKEIFEEDEAVKRTIESGSKGYLLKNLSDDIVRNAENIHIVACGTAYHAGLVGKRFIESLAKVPVRVYYASEFRYTEPILRKGDLVIAVSQSGETADTLGAMRYAKYYGIHTFAIVNVRDSALYREADSVFVTEAGKEVSVASTKAYHVQLAAFALVALKVATVRRMLISAEADRLLSVLLTDVPSKIKRATEFSRHFESVAKKYMNSRNMFFIGRGVDVAQSKEAALKMKEISYIHCNAFAAGELKHGSIALVEKGTPVVAIITEMSTFDKMKSNIMEVKSRGASVILITSENTQVPSGLANDIIYLPETEEIFMPFVCATATQLLAYYTSLNLGHDVDKPRNLAKSVTVE